MTFIFFLRRHECKTHLLDTLNIRVGLMKKILEAFEKNFRAKNEDFHRIFESDLDAKFWMLKKTHESLISVLRIGLVCRTFLIFLRLQRPESNASFTYLDHDRVTSRKFFRSVWKNAASWKIFSKSSSVASLTWFGATWFDTTFRLNYVDAEPLRRIRTLCKDVVSQEKSSDNLA